MFSNSWNLYRGKERASSRSSLRSAFASSAGRKLWMTLQGVCAAISGGEKRWSVLPFFVIGVVVDGLDDDDDDNDNNGLGVFVIA